MQWAKTARRALQMAVSTQDRRKLSLMLLSAEKIARTKQTVGHFLVSFLKTFRERCGPAAEHFHIGPTTQDILDTGRTLMIKESHELVLRSALKLADILCEREYRHRDTLVMGRTHQQHAVPTTFGFVLSIWASEIVEGLAMVSRGLASAMWALHMPATRDSTRISVEFACIPQIYMMTARVLEITCANMAGLVVHADRMRYNVHHPNVLDQSSSERLMIAIHKKTGEKNMAHTLLHDLAVKSNQSGTPFKQVVSGDHRINTLFSRKELDALMDLSSYTGTASLQTAQAIEAIRNRLKRYRKKRGGNAIVRH